jgi:hypothetical protein
LARGPGGKRIASLYSLQVFLDITRQNHRYLEVTMPGSQRITVRLPEGHMGPLQQYCAERNCDVSHVVRLALDAFLATDMAPADDQVSPKRITPPDEIMKPVRKYFAWGSGDLRAELCRLYIEVLAASYACRRLFPRTASVVNGYEGLLQLCRYFGLE